MKQTKLFFILFFLVFGVSSVFAQKGKSKPKEKKSAYDMQGPFCNGLARVKKEHKWGYIDTTGNIVVPLKYNEVTNFSEGLARVRKGQKWGLIDAQGTILIKPEFDFIGEFVGDEAKVMLDKEVFYTNRKGERIK